MVTLFIVSRTYVALASPSLSTVSPEVYDSSSFSPWFAWFPKVYLFELLFQSTSIDRLYVWGGKKRLKRYFPCLGVTFVEVPRFPSLCVTTNRWGHGMKSGSSSFMKSLRYIVSFVACFLLKMSPPCRDHILSEHIASFLDLLAPSQALSRRGEQYRDLRGEGSLPKRAWSGVRAHYPLLNLSQYGIHTSYILSELWRRVWEAI